MRSTPRRSAATGTTLLESAHSGTRWVTPGRTRRGQSRRGAARCALRRVHPAGSATRAGPLGTVAPPSTKARELAPTSRLLRGHQRRHRQRATHRAHACTPPAAAAIVARVGLRDSLRRSRGCHERARGALLPAQMCTVRLLHCLLRRRRALIRFLQRQSEFGRPRHAPLRPRTAVCHPARSAAAPMPLPSRARREHSRGHRCAR